MLEKAINRIVSLAENKTYQIAGENYSDKTLVRIPPHWDTPEPVSVCTLESIIRLIKTEHGKIRQHPILVHVSEFSLVQAFTTYRTDFGRDYLYKSFSDTPSPTFGWTSYESTMISLRSQFVQNEDIKYLLELLSSITDENSVKSEDNGLSQSVEARKGISLKTMASVRSRVTLRPFRTFLEVEQPESEFILRLQEGGRVGLFEADGGMWKLTAKRSIKDYLEKELAELIEAGSVVVTV